jgi:putative hydrolase of the HAD superfamily
LFPDVLPALDALGQRGYRLGLLSNTQSFGLSLLERTGLRRRLDIVRLSCFTGFLKPDPRAFADVVAALGLRPPEAVMVGDSLEDDIAGARRSGLGVVLLRRQVRGLSHREHDAPDDVIADLTGLVDRLERQAQ